MPTEDKTMTNFTTYRGRKVTRKLGAYCIITIIHRDLDILENNHLASSVERCFEDAEECEKKALAKGYMVESELTGRTVWRERRRVLGPVGTRGRFVWNDDLDKVQCEWVEHTMEADGTSSTKVLRKVWVYLENL